MRARVHESRARKINDAQNLGVAYERLQLSPEWNDAKFKARENMAAGLSLIARYMNGTRIATLGASAKTPNDHKDHILNAWEHGRTNAVTESMNRLAEDQARQCESFMSFAGMRRRMLAHGHERKPRKPIRLFTRSKKEGGQG